MSAISGFINTIRSAVYGEQVRGAIVNALEQCYSDVESPSLNQAAFTAALNEAYAGGILDIQTVTNFNDMTNDKIIYRYNGTAAGKQKGLYYFSALSNSWVLIGSEIQKVSLLSQMTDVNDIYKYIGTESGMVQNSLYCHNGTSWVPIGSGVLTASTAAQMTNTDAIYKYTGTESGYITNSLYYYNGTTWAPVSGEEIGVFDEYENGLTPKAPSNYISEGEVTPAITYINSSSATISGTMNGNIVKLKPLSETGSWQVAFTGLKNAIVSKMTNFIAIGNAGTGAVCISASGTIYKVASDGRIAQLGTYQPIANISSYDATIRVTERNVQISANGQTVNIDISTYGVTNPNLGVVYLQGTAQEISYENLDDGGGYYVRDNTKFLRSDGQWVQVNEANQWDQKAWFCYGTSLSSTSQGKYPQYLAALSGMNVSVKGIPAGSITNNGSVAQAVMTLEDGKQNADLITLEVGANDLSNTLGTIRDTQNNTFCGALNQCIQYLQENTSAQIVIMSSTSSTNEDGFMTEAKYNQIKAIREICQLNGVYYIPMCEGLGLGVSRMNSSYIVDNIHHTDLGGYNLARGIWGYLKNIPLWYTSIPT